MVQAPPQASLIGRVIDGRYEVLEFLGEGGMGVVYKARQKSIDRLIAIKVMHAQLARDPSWVQRFYNEAKACSRLQHPNTIRMFDFGQSRDGQLFMTMEYLEGQSLRRAIADSAPMDPVRVLKILIQCCGSLSEAHNLGIIHRDIKPDNVFLLHLAGTYDHVKVLDFSVAKLLQETEASLRTQAGVVFGTPEYMSPEQGRGQALDPRSDLYGLGILAYEMLVRDVPFQDENPLNVLQMHMRSPVPPIQPRVPPEVEAIVRRCLEKDPPRRFQSAVEMMTHAQQVVGHLTGATPPHMASLGGQMFSSPAAYHSPSPAAGRSGALPPTAVAGPGAPTVLAEGMGPEQQKLRELAAAEKRTLMADVAGIGPIGGPPPPAHGPHGHGPPGHRPHGHGPPPPAAGPPQQYGQVAPLAQPPAPGGPYHRPAGDAKKTMLLDTSEGVVSFANQGGAVPYAAPPGAPPPAAAPRAIEPAKEKTGPVVTEGPSIVFWIICLVAGLAVGVGAYWLVLELGH